MHKSITRERVEEAVIRQQTSLDNPGFCIYCGEDADSCEPDAENDECEFCGENGVCGAELLMMKM